MELLLHLSDLSPEPLHGQISRQIRARILAHEVEADEPVPSIRALAREQRVSVITVQRAYDDLEREGFLRSRPGKGFFVVSIPEERKQTMAEHRLELALDRLIAESVAEGLERPQIREVFERVLRGNGGPR